MDKNNQVLSGAALIAGERRRQITEEGWSAEHDSSLIQDQLAYAAICYADPRKREVKIPEGLDGNGWPTKTVDGVTIAVMPPSLWPWGKEEWKPTPRDRVRELIKAGALIAAEIDRLLKSSSSAEEQKYIIAALCDPYNARYHHNGERVICHNGATPVEWVHDDNLGEGYSLEEAKNVLWELALHKSMNNPDWYHEDDESVAEIRRQHLEDKGESAEPEWYKGEGVYENGYPILLKGDTSFRDDEMSYSIEEL